MHLNDPRTREIGDGFGYTRPLAASDPDCVSTFVRSFQHQDWVDGESVVQAEQSTAEDGFNLRFHRIEQDLDSLAADVARVFGCLAELRASLSPILEEISDELNRIDTEVFGSQPPFHEIHRTDDHDDHGLHRLSLQSTPHGAAREPFYEPGGTDPAHKT